MLKPLLDGHNSQTVAKGLRRAGRKIAVFALAEWEDGILLGLDDAGILREAAAQGFTVVTYDHRTIPPLLKTWAESGLPHSSVIFVDEKTISHADIGGLVHAWAALEKEAQSWDWGGRVCFLRR